MSIYKTVHKHVGKLRLNRFESFRKARKVLISVLNKRPVLINNSYYMYVDSFDSLDLLANKTYEPDETKLFERIIKKGSIALDIGANIGYYSLLLAQVCDKVYAFEPEVSNYELLKKNIRLNKLEGKIIAEHKALSDKNQTLRLNLDKYFGGGASVVHKHENYQFVQGVTVDSYFTTKPQIDYVKIDVEGYELNVLKGMQKTLAKNKNIKIVMEFGRHQQLGEAKSKKLLAFLRAKGFKFSIIENGLKKATEKQIMDASKAHEVNLLMER